MVCGCGCARAIVELVVCSGDLGLALQRFMSIRRSVVGGWRVGGLAKCEVQHTGGSRESQCIHCGRAEAGRRTMDETTHSKADEDATVLPSTISMLNRHCATSRNGMAADAVSTVFVFTGAFPKADHRLHAHLTGSMSP